MSDNEIQRPRGAAAATPAADTGPASGPSAELLPRMGGIALRNGLVLVSDDYWAAAIRETGRRASAWRRGARRGCPRGGGDGRGAGPARRAGAGGAGRGAAAPVRGSAPAGRGAQRRGAGGRLPGPADAAGPGPFRRDPPGGGSGQDAHAPGRVAARRRAGGHGAGHSLRRHRDRARRRAQERPRCRRPGWPSPPSCRRCCR